MGLVKFKQTQRRPFFINGHRTDPITEPATFLPSSFIVTAGAATGVTLATLNDPFAGLGLGTTTYATYGTVPTQLALSGASVNATSTATVASTTYALSVLATSGDGLRKVGETLTFTAA